MSTVLLVSRLVLAAILGVAGAAKLFDHAGSRRAAAGFGVPASIAGAFAIALPLAELAAAGLLLVDSTALAGAAIAVVLLAGFSAAIAVQIARGRAPDCHCFGQLHSAPAGPATLARNGVLLGLAIFAATATVARGDAGASALDWLGDASSASLLALAAAVVAANSVVVTLLVLRRHGAVLLHVEALESALAEHGIALDDEPAQPARIERGLPPETLAPDFALERAGGGRASLGDLLDGNEGTLLVFADPQCGPCNALMPDVARWQRELAGYVEVAVVTRAGGAPKRGLRNVLVQEDREVASAYEVTGTPSAVVVAADGQVASALAEGADAIRRLAAELGIEDDAEPARPALRVVQAGGPREPAKSAPAPELDLDGETVLLFWRSSCGFCDRMLPELREFAALGESERRPVVVVTGAGDPGPEVGLPIVQDSGGALARKHRARGTPMAVLVDAGGQPLTPVAAGAQAALELAALDGDRADAQTA